MKSRRLRLFKHLKHLKHVKRETRWYFGVTGLLLSPLSLASQDCFEQAYTPLIRLYCEIQEQNPAEELPSLSDFRKNSEKIQSILLKHPARRLGLKVPTPDNSHSVNPKSKSKSKSKSSKYTISTAKTNTQVMPKQNINCDLHEERLICGDIHFNLQKNLTLNQLPPNALSKNNQLNLPKKTIARFNNRSDHAYLSELYPRYIHKMLDIGLGDSTVSFTKFFALYQQSIKNGNDFSERSNNMFRKLQQERLSNGIRARYKNNYPMKIEQCMRLDNDIFVCDNKQQNWVYKKEGSH
ncbi:MAG: hypothetical protein ACI93R_001579 [Flavobacteriales bacterium]|jgi:hypothetical protein